MLHLGRCQGIRRGFWTYFVDLIGEMGFEKPGDLDRFLMTGAMDDERVASEEVHVIGIFTIYRLEVPLCRSHQGKVGVGTGSFGQCTEASHGDDT